VITGAALAKTAILSNTWNSIKEVDLRPLRQEALEGVKIALIGNVGIGRRTLAEQMRRDPARPHLVTDTPVWILELDHASQALEADLVIILVNPARTDISIEKELVEMFSNKGKKVLVFLHQPDETDEMIVITPEKEWGKRRVVWGSVEDTEFLLNSFTPAVISLIPHKLLGLGRYFPLFRVPIAHYLINDNCLTNASYALSTGLAETIAIFDIPIAVADSIILTKNQAYLAYKLGLTLGYSTRWQDYVAEFGGVLGSGFAWRQIARTLVGFIPVWGLIPKTAIAYAGTYVVGHTILQWYLTGRHLSRKQIQKLYARAITRGRDIAGSMLRRLPHLKLPRVRIPQRKRKALPKKIKIQKCSHCGKDSASDANYCQYCGSPFQ
jgi:uncharacterized protein (DUF697 family)